MNDLNFIYLDQPFESEFPDSEFNFKNAGFGKMLRSLPILPVENYEEWALKDLEEIKATRFELDIEIINNPGMFLPSTISLKFFVRSYLSFSF